MLGWGVQPQFGDPFEVTPVPGHQDEVVGERGRADQEIEVGDKLSLPAKCYAVA
jgi:hypothetical protein